MARRNRDLPYDVNYGIASVSVTTGNTIIATTESAYHGLAVIAGSTADAIITLYDNSAAYSGNKVDLVRVPQGADAWIDRFIPVVAKSGLAITITGTGAYGTVFYAPKG